jgi:S1-C subfamily serine protease
VKKLIVVSIIFCLILFGYSTLPDAVDEVYDSVVHISMYEDGMLISEGSGVIVDTGVVLTAKHVLVSEELKGLISFDITFSNGETCLIDSYYVDPCDDYGFSKFTCDREYKIAKIGDSNELELGDSVFIIGSPLGLQNFNSVTHGIISGFDRLNENLIQTDSPIAPGNSGGPMFNIKGEVVGIVVKGFIYYDGLGYCIPSNNIDFNISNKLFVAINEY